MRIPSVVHADELIRWSAQIEIDRSWWAARPLPYSNCFERWRVAWLVLTGKADALMWRNQ